MNKYLVAIGSLSALNGYAADRPNILLIMADQLTPGVLSCYGGPVSTPNLDRLANEGVLFTNAVCNFPISSPSRASLITGQYPHKHGIIHNCMNVDYPMMPGPVTEECINNNDITTEKILHNAGYATHQYGKWHLTQSKLSYYPDMYGEHLNYAVEMKSFFDSVRFTPRDTWMNWYDWALPVSQTTKFLNATSQVKVEWQKRIFGDFVLKMGRLRIPLEDNFDYRSASRTIDAIEQCAGSPFMITCSFNTPHDPNVCPSPYYEMFNPEDIELPENSAAIDPYFNQDWSTEMAQKTGEKGVREFLRIYYANVKLIDDQVGRILQVLEKQGVYDETIIVFTSDHGDMAGSHGMLWKSTSAFYNEVVKVPLIIRFPQKIKPGSFKVPVSLVDVMPTLLEFTGNPLPASCQGNSFFNLVTGKEKEKNHYPFAFCERMPANPGNVRKMKDNVKGSFMIMSQTSKYIEYADGTCFFYDLKNDPGETINGIDDPKYLRNIRMLKLELEKWLAKTR
jgi:arylsulfatase A-like enzyme